MLYLLMHISIVLFILYVKLYSYLSIMDAFAAISEPDPPISMYIHMVFQTGHFTNVQVRFYLAQG